jgi:dihydropyrimidinase
VIRGETCTHYLLFDESVHERDNGWMYVVKPPIRGVADRDALWNALSDGTLSCVATDHCAYGLDDKRPGFEDFLAMPAGLPGLDARVPMVWSEGVDKHRLSVNEFANVTSLGPARTFGLYPRKGSIRLGADADLVLYDRDREWRWPAFQSGWGSDWDLYEGLAGRGLPTLTLRHGSVIAYDGQFVGDYSGRYLSRTIDTGLW